MLPSCCSEEGEGVLHLSSSCFKVLSAGHRHGGPGHKRLGSGTAAHECVAPVNATTTTTGRGVGHVTASSPSKWAHPGQQPTAKHPRLGGLVSTSTAATGVWGRSRCTVLIVAFMATQGGVFRVVLLWLSKEACL